MKFNRGGFSWNRFLGITNVKRKISRKTGIPLTRSGRQQKIGRIVSKGCLGMLMMGFISIGIVILFVVH